ncbi:MAG TPA: DAK2 domain-containing protein [Candidatus Cloacimonetes bacterium]|nr:DAK2 domain-containing protein [Candidatus Cloacimonadota bacterium]
MPETNTIQLNGDSYHYEPVYEVDGQELKKAFYASLVWLKNHQPVINALNVFPVPDGDTGTNMFLTMQSAYNEIAESLDNNAGKIISQIAQGALMGARGNSGVILSQLLRGFARVMDEQKTINSDILVKSLAESRNTAYKGVVRPVEGTILTVSKDIASAAKSAAEDTEELISILNYIVAKAEESVKNTPNLLPILKQAGVVDSGGKGLLIILEGMLRYATGQSLEMDEAEIVGAPINFEAVRFDELHEEIEPGQDFEIVVDFTPSDDIDLDKLYGQLSEIGTSIQMGEGDKMYRMHIHVPTDNKYQPIELVSKFGIVQKVYIENLLEQMNKQGKKQEFTNKIEEGQIAVIAVSPGDGISRIFKSLGVARIVSGGQTMNPSTNDILKSFDELPTDKIIILPNNKNIILAAKSTKDMTDKKVEVVPTRNIPQGLVACLRLNPSGEFEEIVEQMKDSLDEVDAGEITIATRSIQINGVKVKEGEAIALLNGDLVASSNNITDVCLTLLEKAETTEKEHITLFYGENVTQEMVDNLVKNISDSYPDHEIEVHDGGQPHYQFILSIE